MSIEGQGHFLTLTKDHLHMKHRLILSVTTGPFQPNFECFKYKEMKIHQHNAGHMTKMAAMLIHGKHILKNLSMNHWSDCDETLYEASETLALYILFKL